MKIALRNVTVIVRIVAGFLFETFKTGQHHVYSLNRSIVFFPKESSKMQKFRKNAFEGIQSDWTKKNKSIAKYVLGKLQKNILFSPIIQSHFAFNRFYGKIKVLKDPSLFCKFLKPNYNVEILCMFETFYNSKDS